MTLSAAHKQIFGLQSGGGDGQGNRKSFRPPSHPPENMIEGNPTFRRTYSSNIIYDCCVEVHYWTLESSSNDDGDGNENGIKAIKLDGIS